MSNIPPESHEGQQAMMAETADDAAPEGDEYYEEEAVHNSGRFIIFNAVPAWAVSMVVHAVLLFIMALITIGGATEKQKNTLTIAQNDDVEQIDDFDEPVIEPVEITDVSTEDVTEVVTQTAMEAVETTVDTVVSFSDDLEAAPLAVELNEFSETTAPKSDLIESTEGAIGGTGVSGRGAAVRGKMLKKGGGTSGSEAAVTNALAWLAAHQYPDGGFSFDHTRISSCAGQCDHPGGITARNGATGIALLPFLGFGQTHKEGKYKRNVEYALKYLVQNMKVKGNTGSYHEPGGTMYSHGIAAIALSEAYAMTHDKGLMAPAQLSLNFISAAQDPVGGGWRYQPQQPGDTSAVGWQIMALKSGHMGYLQVMPNTVRGATRFLDSVQQDSGSFYGYTSPGKGSATTAVGLLSRMYLGWKQDNPALERGAQYLAKTGPSANNMYFNYYATQVIKQYYGDDSPEWNKWNVKLRDFLIKSQDKTGHKFGSWHFNGGGHAGERGGRLYNTAMATMILEVYYRHLPIYGKAAAKEEFPL